MNNVIQFPRETGKEALTRPERRKAALLARDFLLELERERRERRDYCLPALARRQELLLIFVRAFLENLKRNAE